MIGLIGAYLRVSMQRIELYIICAERLPMRTMQLSQLGSYSSFYQHKAFTLVRE